MKKIRLHTLLIALLASLAVLACSGSASSVSNELVSQPAQTVGPQAVLEIEPTLESEPPSLTVAYAAAPSVEESIPSSRDAPEPLDAHAVVAAYEEVFTGIYEAVLPSVVQVKVLTDANSRRRFGRSRAPVPTEGSGFIWSSEGHVVTNHHVIEGATRVHVVFADGSELKATVLGSDPTSDLAVLLIDSPPENLKAVPIGDSSDLSVGQLSVAIGSPFGQEFTMTRGIISALGRRLQAGDSIYINPQIIQTDAPINPGNSGGPLLNRNGEIIGINSRIISSTGSNAGVGFAVPINTAMRIIPELIEDGEYEYPYIGLSGRSVTPTMDEANGLPVDTSGVMITGLVAGGPADQAGFSAASDTRTVSGVEYPAGGEIITSIDGTAVEGLGELVAYMVENNKPGDMVTMEVITGIGTSVRAVTLGTRPEGATS